MTRANDSLRGALSCINRTKSGMDVTTELATAPFRTMLTETHASVAARWLAVLHKEYSRPSTLHRAGVVQDLLMCHVVCTPLRCCPYTSFFNSPCKAKKSVQHEAQPARFLRGYDCYSRTHFHLVHDTSGRTPVGGYCGSAQGSLCCPVAAYCQPWNSDYYQCLALPTGCRGFETDIDYTDNDIGSASKVSPADCCAKCQATGGCKFFTFVNLDPQGPTCYMKNAKSTGVRKVGAASGHCVAPTLPPTEAPTAASTVTPTPNPTQVPAPAPTGAPTATPTEEPTEAPTETPSEAPDPTPTESPAPGSCSTQLDEECDLNFRTEFKYCPEGSFCQNARKSYEYRCLPLPEVCGEVETGVEYDGEDVGQAVNVTIAGCATKCRETEGCNFYNFVSLDHEKYTATDTQFSLCYLKRKTVSTYMESVYAGSINGASSIEPTPALLPAITISPDRPLPENDPRCIQKVSYKVALNGVVLKDFLYGGWAPAHCSNICISTLGSKGYTHTNYADAQQKRCVLLAETTERVRATGTKFFVMSSAPVW